MPYDFFMVRGGKFIYLAHVSNKAIQRALHTILTVFKENRQKQAKIMNLHTNRHTAEQEQQGSTMTFWTYYTMIFFNML